MTPHDRLTATIKKRLPRLQDWEVAALVKDIESEGLLAQGYIGEIDSGDWELATIRLDIDRQMFKDGQVKIGAQVLIVPQPPKADTGA